MSNLNTMDDLQLCHVANRNQKSLTDHGQKLFNAINCFLNDQEQLELTEALFKYQKEHNVFTLVRCCREIFDNKHKKSLMIFMRPVIPIRDRFHYDEYYKLFFQEEFDESLQSSRSIFKDLIPDELVQKTIDKADKKRINAELEEMKKYEKNIELLEKINLDLNIDLSELTKLEENEESKKIARSFKLNENDDEETSSMIKIAGFRILELDLLQIGDSSLGFNICTGPTQTFIMISYIDSNSKVFKLGMRVGDELVSLNEISLKMQTLDFALNLLTNPSSNKLKIVLQTSGFLPNANSPKEISQVSLQYTLKSQENDLKWSDIFDVYLKNPQEMNLKMKTHVRNITIMKINAINELGICVRGGIEYNLGIFISNVKINSIAHKSGLKKGDQLLFVNNISLAQITLNDALYIIYKSCLNNLSKNVAIHMTVRYLGLLPSVTNDHFISIVMHRLDNFKEVLNNSKIQDDEHKNTLVSLFNNYFNHSITIEFLCEILKRIFNKQNENMTSFNDYIYDYDKDYFNSKLQESDDITQSLIHTQSYNDLTQIDTQLKPATSLDNLKYFL